MRASREEQKVLAVKRAEFALKQRLERIDWNEDVLYPEQQRLRNMLGEGIEVTAELVENVEEDK